MNSMINRVRFWRVVLGLLIGLLIAFVIGVWQAPSLALISEATITEIVDGDQVFIEAIPAKVADVALLQQEVRTEESRVSLLFDNGAGGRLGQNSSVVVGQCVEVQEGYLLVSGPADGCLSGFSIGVQGTIYVLGKDNTNPEENGNIKVLEGTLFVKKNETDEPVEVTEGKKVSILANNTLGEVLNISAEEFRDILLGELFDGFQIPVTPEGALRSVCLRLFGRVFNCTSSGVPVPRVSTPSIPRPRLPF